MARIIGGIGTSHVPTIAMAYDRGRQADPDWKPLFESYAPVARWLAEKKPDVLVFCFNDHATTFLFDLPGIEFQRFAPQSVFTRADVK